MPEKGNRFGMTVGEVIAELQKYDPGMSAVMPLDEGGYIPIVVVHVSRHTSECSFWLDDPATNEVSISGYRQDECSCSLRETPKC